MPKTNQSVHGPGPCKDRQCCEPGYKVTRGDLMHILTLTLGQLENGNAKEATDELNIELTDMVFANPADFFYLLMDAAYDRPSAWWEYCALTRAAQKLGELELAMHASCEEKKTRAMLKEHFDSYENKKAGLAARRVLNSKYWST